MTYRRLLTALILTTFTDSLAEEFLHPLIVVRLEEQGVRSFLIGLATSAGDLGVLLAAPFVPALLRAVPPLRYLRASLLLLAGGIFLFPLFPHVYVWVALDFTFGVALCGYLVLSDTLVNASTADAQRGRWIALYMLAESTGAILGPLLLARVGVEGWLPFGVASVIMLAGIAPWFSLAALEPPPLEDGEPAPFLAVLRGAPFVLLVASAGAFFADTPASLLPVFALERGLPETTAILMLSALATGTVVFQLPAGWLADRMDRGTFLGAAAAAIALLALALLPAVSLPWLLWPALLLLGGLMNGVELLGLALLGERSTLRNLAGLNAAATMAGGVASFAGPPGTGLLMDLAGADALVYVVAGVSALLLAASAGDRIRRSRLSGRSRGST